MADPTTVVVDAINILLKDRDDDENLEVTLDARLYEDLRLDSLELAALSERLAEVFVKDPYTEGLSPVTVGDVIAFYQD